MSDPIDTIRGAAAAQGGRRVIIGEDDPTRDDVRPCGRETYWRRKGAAA